MRPIDADAFDERVRVAGGMSEEELTEDFKDGVQAVLYMLSNQPTIQPEPHWIPVTEQLPKEDGSYLVSGKWGSGKESVGDCEFSVKDGYFQTVWNFDVLAWMPLPEPYKEVTT